VISVGVRMHTQTGAVVRGLGLWELVLHMIHAAIGQVCVCLIGSSMIVCFKKSIVLFIKKRGDRLRVSFCFKRPAKNVSGER